MLSSGDDVVKADIAQFCALLSKKHRDASEEKTLQELRQRLDADLGKRETELEQTVAVAVAKTLDSMASAKKFGTEALSYEIKRQLRELLE